jgi:hypothetical protein
MPTNSKKRMFQLIWHIAINQLSKQGAIYALHHIYAIVNSVFSQKKTGQKSSILFVSNWDTARLYRTCVQPEVLFTLRLVVFSKVSKRLSIGKMFQESSKFDKKLNLMKQTVKNVQESKVKQSAKFQIKQFVVRLQEQINYTNFSRMNERGGKTEMFQMLRL